MQTYGYEKSLVSKFMLNCDDMLNIQEFLKYAEHVDTNGAIQSSILLVLKI